MLPCERAYVWGAKVAPDLRGCPPGKGIRMHAILKENTTNCISLQLERLINVDFEKKIAIAGFSNSAKENPHHALVSQHLRNIQAKFHRNLLNRDTLLIYLFD